MFHRRHNIIKQLPLKTQHILKIPLINPSLARNKNNKQPLITGEDGKAVLEVIFAVDESAGLGEKVMLPFKSDVDKPYKLWKK